MLRVAPIDMAAALVSSTIPETDHAAWSSGSAYTIGNAVIRTETHRVYEAKGSVGPSATPPEDDPDHWLDREATDRHKPFDFFSNRTFTATDPSAVFDPTQPVDTLLVFGMICESITVLVEYDGNELQNDTFEMLVNDTATDYMSWIMAIPEPMLHRAVPVNFIPGATITITANGETTGGKLLLGVAEDWGVATWDTSISHRGYSRIDEDDFGIASVIKRRSVFDMNFRVTVPPERVPLVKRRVQSAEGLVSGYIGTRTALYDSMVLGIMTDMGLDYGSPGGSNYNLTVRGIY